MEKGEMTCPCCGPISYVWQFVTEQRRYSFRVGSQEYMGRSDPVDDTSSLDYLACPRCGEELPQEISSRIQALSEFSRGP